MKNVIHMLSDSAKHGSGPQMNSFVIETESKELIVIDGGWKEDGKYLLEYLKKISGKEKPFIAGWFLTHAHSDHIDCFLDITEYYSDSIEIGHVYYNFPSIQFVERNEPVSVDSIRNFYRLLPGFADRAVIVTRGDCYTIGEAQFQILYSPNPIWTHNAINNASIVVRMIFGGRSVMFLADLGVEAGCQILEEYGADLKSDYCQMAHHGQNGVTKEVYRAIAPEACIWCTPEWLWNNDHGNGFNTASYKTIEVRDWMEELGVRKHYVTKDGDQMIVL